MPFFDSNIGSGICTAGFLAFGLGRAAKKAVVYVRRVMVASMPHS